MELQLPYEYKRIVRGFMKNVPLDYEVLPAEVVEMLADVVAEVYASHQKFVDTYVEGSILYIPTGYRTEMQKEIFLRYESRGLFVCSARSMNDALIGFRHVQDESEFVWYGNEISVHDQRFTIAQHDNGCIVRLDSDDRNSPKQEMTVDIEDDICYYSGTLYGGVDETVFLYSLEYSTRPVEDIRRELAACTKMVNALPPKTEVFSDATDFAEKIFYTNFITGNLI